MASQTTKSVATPKQGISPKSSLIPKGKMVNQSSSQVNAKDIIFSDKFNKGRYQGQVTARGWDNQMIADTINNPVKISQSVNKATGNSVTNYYINDTHYVAVDNGTKKNYSSC